MATTHSKRTITLLVWFFGIDHVVTIWGGVGAQKESNAVGAVEYRMLVAYRQAFPRGWNAVRDRTRDNQLNRLIQRITRRVRGTPTREEARPSDRAASWRRVLWNTSRKVVPRVARISRDTSAKGRAAAQVASARMSRAAARIRPRPLRDGAVVAILGVVTLAMLAVSIAMASAFSAWLRTSPGDVLLAAGSAVTVGTLFLVVMFLVFASKDRTVRRGRTANVGTAIATRGPAVPAQPARRSGAADDIDQPSRVVDAA